jgi:hypothetical protein
MPNDKASVIRHVKELRELGIDDNFANALGDLVEVETASSSELDQAMNDPKRYFEDRGVQLPHNATVKITKSPLNVVACLTSDDRAHTWCVVYTFAESDL